MAAGTKTCFRRYSAYSLPGDILQDDRRQKDSVGRIGGLQSRRAIANELVAHEGRHVGRGLAIELTPGQLVESAGMAQEVTERQRRIALRGDLDPAQIAIDVGVEVNAAVIDKLQHRHGGDDLADRSDWPDGARRIDRRSAPEVRDTVSVLISDFSAVDEYEGRAWRTRLRQFRLDDRIDRRGDDGLEAGFRLGRCCVDRIESKQQDRDRNQDAEAVVPKVTHCS